MTTTMTRRKRQLLVRYRAGGGPAAGGALIALGGTAAEAMLGVRKGLGELRNKVHTYNGIPLVVTYHPAALLRNPAWKRDTWEDVKLVRQIYDREVNNG